jgi:hypothetical protein
MRGGVTLLRGDATGPRLCSAGLPDCWGGGPGAVAFGHLDGVLLVERDGPPRWAPLDGVVAVDGHGGGWLALTEVDDGGVTAWVLEDDGWQPRARLPAGAEGCRLEGGALIEVRGARRQAARLLGTPAAIPLPMGAERGRLAVAADGIAWADGPDLYRRERGGVPRPAGQAPGPVTRLQRAPGGHLIATIARDRTLVVPRHGRARVLPHASPEPAALDGERALLQIDDDVLELRWADPELRWHRDCRLCGGTWALHDPDEATLTDLSGRVLLDGLWPAAATATPSHVLGPGGRAWPRDGSAPPNPDPGLLAEHLVSHEGHLLAIFDGEARVRGPDGVWQPPRPLPSPFDDPYALEAVRLAAGGVVLVGEDERVHWSWRGQVRRGLVPRSRRLPGPPAGWHWNEAGLLLHLG